MTIFLIEQCWVRSNRNGVIILSSNLEICVINSKCLFNLLCYRPARIENVYTHLECKHVEEASGHRSKNDHDSADMASVN